MNDRVTLHRGDTFRAKGGPYYVDADGKKTKMVERGALKFVAYCERGEQKWIEAYSASGGFTILSLTDRESIMPGRYVARPYRIMPAKKDRAGRFVEADPEDIAKAGGKPDKRARRAAKRAAGARREIGSLRASARRLLAGGGAAGGSGATAPGLASGGLLGAPAMGLLLGDSPIENVGE